jgi:hypothetical protein
METSAEPRPPPPSSFPGPTSLCRSGASDGQKEGIKERHREAATAHPLWLPGRGAKGGVRAVLTAGCGWGIPPLPPRACEAGHGILMTIPG